MARATIPYWLNPLALWRHHPLRLHIAALFTSLIFIACSAIALMNYFESRDLALETAETLMGRIHSETSTEVKSLLVPVESLVSVVANAPVSSAEALHARLSALPGLAEALRRFPQLQAVYIGYETGDFLLLRPVRDEAARIQLNAPPGTEFVLQSIEQADPPRIVFAYKNAKLDTLAESTPANYTFDPRKRPWFIDAHATSKPVVTAPYIFFTTREVGLSIARRAAHGLSVAGADVTLSRLSEKLRQIRPTPSS